MTSHNRYSNEQPHDALEQTDTLLERAMISVEEKVAGVLVSMTLIGAGVIYTAQYGLERIFGKRES